MIDYNTSHVTVAPGGAVKVGISSRVYSRRLGSRDSSLVPLAGLVALGMATGTHRQFDKGEAYLWVVVSVQVLGVISLLTLGGVAWACVSVWQGHRPRIVRWTALAIAIWLAWAFLRIDEYAS